MSIFSFESSLLDEDNSLGITVGQIAPTKIHDILFISNIPIPAPINAPIPAPAPHIRITIIPLYPLYDNLRKLDLLVVLDVRKSKSTIKRPYKEAAIENIKIEKSPWIDSLFPNAKTSTDSTSSIGLRILLHV